MKIVGCDLHTRYQQVAMLDQETGELIERRLEHQSGEALAFYAALLGPVRVGIEATGHTRWFERMLAELGQELWIGDAAQIRASVVRKQKTDARPGELCAAGSHARQPEGHPGGPVRHRWPDWAPCLPEKPGSLNNESWSEVSDRIDGWWNQTSTAGF
jgi:hypothetical protein